MSAMDQQIQDLEAIR
jgi:rRNA biogenesis protein RRP5